MTTEPRQLAADCRVALEGAQTREEIVGVIRRLGLDRIAARINYLIELPLDEADEVAMDIESLRSAIEFLLFEPGMPHPGIGVGPDGNVGFDWRLQPTGIIALSFRSTDLISYAAIVPAGADDEDHHRFSGSAGVKDTFDRIAPVLARAVVG